MDTVKTIKDQLNRSIYLKETPKRIISLVPSQTELLCDLGLESALVGITKFCVHPNHIRENVTTVGGTKQIKIDKIKALQPDIILCNKEENTKEIVEACVDICNVHISDTYIIEDSLDLIHQYGEMFDKHKEAIIITDSIQKNIKEFNTFIENKPVLKAVYFIWKDPWMVAANNTFINYLLRLNKFENIYENETRYPEIKPSESAINKDTDIVLLSSEPYPFKEKHIRDIEVFYPNAKIILADGEMFSWYGSRLIKAFKYFKSLRLNL